jgi:hypothetical protein
MFGRGLGVVGIAVVLAACGGSGEDSSSLTGGSTTITASAPSTIDLATTTSTPVPSTSLLVDGVVVNDDVIEFVAAVDELLVGTAYEDAVVADPEVFVATGWLFCEQLDQEMGPIEILTVYVETLTDSDIEDADDDTLTLAGTLLGTAAGHLCPEHADIVEEGL